MSYKIPKFETRDAFGSLSEVIGWGLTDSKIPNTWKITKGKNINIFILDTGLSTHPDLTENLIAGVNCTKEKDAYDENGHSTACCSIIGAKENDDGMVGIAPECNMITVKIMDKQGTGDIASIYAGLKFCLDETLSGGQRTGYTPNILSLSIGSPDPFPSFVEDLLIKLYNAGVIIVCAAGNSGKKVEYPAAYPWTIAVGSYDPNGKISNFSSRGPEIEFVAPGSEIYTCFLNNGYKIVRGTSFSCPFIVGIIALALAKHRDQELLTGKNDCKNVQQLRQHLVRYSKDLGTLGKDNEYGYGAIDVEGLLNGPDEEVDLPILQPFLPAKKKKKWWQKLLGI